MYTHPVAAGRTCIYLMWHDTMMLRQDLMVTWYDAIRYENDSSVIWSPAVLPSQLMKPLVRQPMPELTPLHLKGMINFVTMKIMWGLQKDLTKQKDQNQDTVNWQEHVCPLTEANLTPRTDKRLEHFYWGKNSLINPKKDQTLKVCCHQNGHQSECDLNRMKSSGWVE